MPSTCSIRPCQLHDGLDKMIRIIVTVMLFIGWGWFSFICMLFTFWDFNPSRHPFQYARLLPASFILFSAILFSWILEWMWKGRCWGQWTSGCQCNWKRFRMSCLVFAAMIGWAILCIAAFGGGGCDKEDCKNEGLLPVVFALLVTLLLAGTSSSSVSAPAPARDEPLLQVRGQVQLQQRERCDWAGSCYQLLRLLGYLILGFLLVYCTYLITEYCGSSDGGFAAGYLVLFSFLCLVFPTWGYFTRHTILDAKPYPFSRANVSLGVFAMWTLYAYRLLRSAIFDDLLDGNTDDNGNPYPFLEEGRLIAVAILLALLVGTAIFLEWLWQRPLDRWHRFRRDEQNPEYYDDLVGCQPFCLVTGSILGWSLVCYYLMTWMFPEDCQGKQEQQHCQSMLYSAFRFGVLNLTALLLLIGFWPEKKSQGDHDDDAGEAAARTSCSCIRTSINWLLRFICLMILFGFLLYYAYLILDAYYHLQHPVASWIMGILLSLASLVWGFFFRRLFCPDTSTCCFGYVLPTTVEMITSPLVVHQHDVLLEQETLLVEEEEDCPPAPAARLLSSQEEQHRLVV